MSGLLPCLITENIVFLLRNMRHFGIVSLSLFWVFAGIADTVNTANASHCYEIGAYFRHRGFRAVFGGPVCDTVLNLYE